MPTLSFLLSLPLQPSITLSSLSPSPSSFEANRGQILAPRDAQVRVEASREGNDEKETTISAQASFSWMKGKSL